jgi:hypothetical protein
MNIFEKSGYYLFDYYYREIAQGREYKLNIPADKKCLLRKILIDQLEFLDNKC